MTSNDLISRDDVYNVLKKVNGPEMPILIFDKLWKGIRNLPSAEPERKKGKWNNYKDEHSCSVCHSVVIQENWDDDIRYDFCPYCGAEMGEGEE